jgi:predicted metal-dependent hydrolase
MMENYYENIEIIRSRRKTITIEINRNLQVLVRVPYSTSNRDIQQLIKEKSSWIKKHMELIKRETDEHRSEPVKKFTEKEIRQLAEQALRIIPERVAYYAPIIGVHVAKITIRNQVSRWGSCSSKGNLNFNCLLMLTPPDVIDYVVVHELCHRKELNHSAKFWSEVSRILPNYQVPKKWLKDNGTALIQRLR